MADEPIGFERIRNELNEDKKVVQQLGSRFRHEEQILNSEKAAVQEILTKLKQAEELFNYVLLLQKKSADEKNSKKPNVRYVQETLQGAENYTYQLRQLLDDIERDLRIVADGAKISVHEIHALQQHLSELRKNLDQLLKKGKIGFKQ